MISATNGNQDLASVKTKSSLPPRDWAYYWELGLKTVKELETDQGILASGRHEWYGAIFGRDSLITSLKLLRVYQQTKIPDFLNTVRKVLLTLAELQGKEVNTNSGEEPGKCIHEYRPDGHEHLTQGIGRPWGAEKAWYVYPDNELRNYDSVDATSLFLITINRYLQFSDDQDFEKKILAKVRLALEWVFEFGDSNHDGLIDYDKNLLRKFGGPAEHTWMDGVESKFHEDGSVVSYPLAPVEAQAYTYMALRLWSNYNWAAADYNSKLARRAVELKKIFNEQFVIQEGKTVYLAAAIDGRGKPLKNIRSTMGHALWSALNLKDDGIVEGIVDHEYVDGIVRRLMAPDLFEPDGGIRTLSSLSSGFYPNSYHNGSIWPHDSSIVAEGLENYGYLEEAAQVRQALLKAVAHFQTPIELFAFDKTYFDYRSPQGQTASRIQAWSAAAVLRSVADQYLPDSGKPSPYKLVGFKIHHATVLSVLEDKLKLREGYKIGNKTVADILKMVAQIRVLNVLEKLRQEKLIPYRDKLIKSHLFTLLSDREKDQMKKIFKKICEKISL